MSHYLMIENPGEAPIEGLLLHGATTKDPTKDDSVIGMFGSGTKYAVLSMLRGNLFPIITSGTNRLEWSYRPILVGGTEHKEVYYSLNNKSSRSTGSVLASGQSDWKQDLYMALREFVSNALDETHGDTKFINFEITSSPRARKGYTRVFVPWAPDGMTRFRDFLQKYFLHFRPGADPTIAGPLPKAWPNSRAQFYRRGVLIRSFGQNTISLFDYNFVDLKLDEARNADDWNMQYESGKLLAKSPKHVAQALSAIASNHELFEAKASQWALDLYDKRDEILAELPPNVLYTSTESGLQAARNKGIEAVMVPDTWAQALTRANLPTTHNKLGEWTSKGIEILDTDLPIALEARVVYWNQLIGDAGLSCDRPLKVRQFRQFPSASKTLYGQADDSGILLNVELGTDSELLDQTILEELAHFHSGCEDFTREFQEWNFRLLVRTMKGKQE